MILLTLDNELASENPCSKHLMEKCELGHSRPTAYLRQVPRSLVYQLPAPIFDFSLSSCGFANVIMMYVIIDIPTTPHPILPGNHDHSSFILDPSPFVNFIFVIIKCRSITQEFSTFLWKYLGRLTIHPSTYQTTQAFQFAFYNSVKWKIKIRKTCKQYRNCTMFNRAARPIRLQCGATTWLFHGGWIIPQKSPPEDDPNHLTGTPLDAGLSLSDNIENNLAADTELVPLPD